MADIRSDEEEIRYWKEAYWNLIYNRSYAPAGIYQFLREVDHLRELNHKQAGMIMDLQFRLKHQRSLRDSKWWDYE